MAQLRELGFPAKTNSSRFLRKPVAELAGVPAVFEQLEISSNGRYLTWRFAGDFFDAMANMDVYALIEASEIALCPRKLDGALLAQIPLQRRKHLPEQPTGRCCRLTTPHSIVSSLAEPRQSLRALPRQ